MNTTTIIKAVKSIPVSKDKFAGVFPSDKLPNRLPFVPCALIVNTDPASLPGQHWVAMYFGADGQAEYFDSYGMSPTVPAIAQFIQNNSWSVHVNNKRVQGYLSSVCGQYCVHFVVCRCASKRMSQIVKPWCGDFVSDSAVTARVNKHCRVTTDTFEDEVVINQLCTAFGF